MTITIATYCPICHTSHDVEVPMDGFFKWQDGACVQDAFPSLSAEEREMLISGICPECWNFMFGKEEN